MRRRAARSTGSCPPRNRATSTRPSASWWPPAAGLANAYAAAHLGVPATVFVPRGAPQIKVDGLRAYGATVVTRGSEYAEAYEAAVEYASTTGAVHCHAYDQPEIAAGAGTLGLELQDQTDGALDTVPVAVGGGGLMAGVAAALEGTARVVAVEPAAAPTLHAALAAGTPVDVGVAGVAADSLGARRVGAIAFDVAVRTGVRSVLVTEEASSPPAGACGGTGGSSSSAARPSPWPPCRRGPRCPSRVNGWR